MVFLLIEAPNLFMVIFNKVGRYWVYVHAHTRECAFGVLIKFLVLRSSARFLK
jgi:hypothetical protein